VKAALAGDGIALGWQHLVGDLLLDGQLVAPVPHMVVTGNNYWAIKPRATRATAAVTRLRDWLLGEAQASERLYADWRRRNALQKSASRMQPPNLRR
jgi:DNA-binding transcriptional LysR family regulator